MTKPCSHGDAPWMRSAASGTKLSTPRNVAVASTRQATTAGRPGRARPTPRGNSRRRKTTATTAPTAVEMTAANGLANCKPGDHGADPDGRGERGRDARRLAVGADGAERGHRAHGQCADGDGQGDDPDEHPPPPEVLGDRPGDRRSDEAGQHPAGRQQGVHGRLAIIGERPPHEQVGDRAERSGAGALEHAAEHDRPHRRRRSGHDETDDEQHDARGVRLGRSVAVGQLTGGDEGHEVRQRVRRQGDAVQRVAAELVGDRRQRGDHRGDLEGDERHAEHQPGRQHALRSGHRGGHGQRGYMQSGGFGNRSPMVAASC